MEKITPIGNVVEGKHIFGRNSVGILIELEMVAK